jgi:Sec-independent protein translocase protein TatA
VLQLSPEFQVAFVSEAVSGTATCDITLNGSGAPPTAPRSFLAAHATSLLILALILLVLFGYGLLRRRRIGRWIRGTSDSSDEPDDAIGLQEVVYDTDEDESAVEAGLARALRSLEDLSDPREAVVRCWVEFEAALRPLGVSRQSAETPKELAKRVLAATQLDPMMIERLQDWYRDARYSQREITTTTRDDARELIVEVLSGLVAEQPAR